VWCSESWVRVQKKRKKERRKKCVQKKKKKQLHREHATTLQRTAG
jgi:hypothetical protein